MAVEWQALTLEDCMDAIIDYRGKSPTKTVAGVPLVTAKIVKGGRILPPEEFIAEKDYQSWMRRGMPAAGDIVMTTEAPLGEVAQLDGRRVALAQRVITLRGKPHLVNNTFLKFLLQSEPVQEELRNRSTGTTVLGIRQSELRKVTLRLPPLPEQKRIANILGTLDDKIELNRRMNATLEAMSRAIFKSWFVDFDPVRQKAAGKQPVGMDAQTAALFPDSFEESEIGDVPKGWRSGSVADYADLNPESWSRDTYPVEVRYVELSSTKWGDVEAAERYGRDSAPSRAQRVLRSGDTIFGTVRPGNGSFALVDEDGLTGSTGFAVLRPKYREFREYVYLATTVAENVDRLAHLADGGAYPAVRPEVVADTPLAAAPHELVAKFSDCFSACFSRIAKNRTESRTLAALRDTLLPKLLSGEIRVPEAEGIVEETVG